MSRFNSRAVAAAALILLQVSVVRAQVETTDPDVERIDAPNRSADANESTRSFTKPTTPDDPGAVAEDHEPSSETTSDSARRELRYDRRPNSANANETETTEPGPLAADRTKFERALAAQPDELTSEPGPIRHGVGAALKQFDVQIQSLQERLGPNHPAVRAALERQRRLAYQQAVESEAASNRALAQAEEQHERVREAIRARHHRADHDEEHRIEEHLERLEFARKSLEQAGLREMEADVARQIESLIQEREDRAVQRQLEIERAAGHRHEPDLHREIREMRHEVRELRHAIEQLHELLDRRTRQPAERREHSERHGNRETSGLSEDSSQIDVIDTGLLVYEAPWCASCKSMQPIWEKLAKEGIRIQRINVAEYPAFARRNKVSAIPMLYIRRNGKTVIRITGKIGESRLRELMKPITGTSGLGEDTGGLSNTNHAETTEPSFDEVRRGLTNDERISGEENGFLGEIANLRTAVRRIRLVQGRSQLIVHKVNVRRTQVAANGIMALIQFTPRELSIVGIAPGTTSLTIWLDGSNTPQKYIVEVVKPNKPRGTGIREVLSKPVTLHFQNIGLSDICQFLAKSAGCSIVLDSAGLQEAGVQATQTVSIDVDGVSCKSALNLILEPLGLGYVVEDEVLKITSEERSGGAMTTVTYAVAELLPNSPPGQEIDDSTYRSLIDLVKSTVSPDSWSEVGGPARLHPFPATQSVCVRANQKTHAQLQNLFTLLRRHVSTGFKKLDNADEPAAVNPPIDALKAK